MRTHPHKLVRAVAFEQVAVLIAQIGMRLDLGARTVLLIVLFAFVAEPARAQGISRVEPNHRFYLPLNNPAYFEASAASFMRDDDYVIGVINRNVKRAYPWAVLSNHHVVNDTIAGDAVVVAHCEVCGSASAYLAEAESKQQSRVSLSFIGRLLDGGLRLVDLETRSIWAAFLGEAVKGRLAGTVLERLPVFATSWQRWRTSHPDTQVVVLSPELRKRPHGLGHFPGDRSVYPGKTQDEFRQLLEANPKLRWLNPAERVIGIHDRTTGAARAYPLARLVAPMTENVVIGEQPVIIVVAGNGASLGHVAVYRALLDGRRIELSPDSSLSGVFNDGEGNKWNAWGECFDGSCKGRRLDVGPGFVTKWYEWVETFPDTLLAGERKGLTVRDAMRAARAKPFLEAQTKWRN